MATNQPEPARSASDRASTVADLARAEGLELTRFAYLLCGDRQWAEDVVQDVLLSMHRRFPVEMSLDNPIGYARRSIANANVSRARKMSSTEVAMAIVPDAAASEAADCADRDLLWQAVRRLPVRQRTVLVLRFYADATDAEIADAIGARRGTVRSLASRAVATLRKDPTLVFDPEDRS